MVISAEEYSRLLKQEIQLIKYKESCQQKSVEVKRLQDQVIYLKKQVLRRKLQAEHPDDPENKKQHVFANVMPHKI